MTDELRKLAEVCLAKEPLEENDIDFPGCGTGWVRDQRRFILAAHPAAVLALLDEIERYKRMVNITDERRQQRETQRDEARASVKRLGTVLNIIAGYSPEVTHGWADDVREMATAALDDPVVKRLVEE